ncbi:MAG: DUF2225 domain-containing protein [Candidatus Hydrogenedentota bacterium]
MPSKQSPFVFKDMACPVCHEKTGHRFFRRRIFTIEETEPDQHAVRYKWTNDNVECVNPLYYALYFCPKCFYTDVAEEFNKCFETESGMATVKAFKTSASDNTLFQLLGQNIDYEDIDFEVALRLHFLAVLIHSLVEKEMQDPYKLGRLYLRIAWLYREREQGLPEGLEPDASTAETSPEEDAGCSPQLLAAAEELQEVQKRYHEQWEALERLAQQRTDELARSAPDEWHNPYPLCIEPLMSAQAQLEERLHELRDLAFRDASGLLRDAQEEAALVQAPDEDEKRRQRRAHFLPHATLMDRLASLWKDVPRNEQDALALALEQFRRALVTDLRLENPQSRLKISSLVVELQIRRGDFDGALEVTRQLHRLAMTSRQKLQARLREDDVSDSEFRRIKNLIQKATATLESAAELRESAIKRMVGAQMPRIREAFATLPSRAQMKDFEDALASHGIPKEIVTYLKKRNMQLPAT